MKNSTSELINDINYLIKEVSDLKRESTKNFLLNKRIYTIKEASLVTSLSESFLYKSVSSGHLLCSRPSIKKILVTRINLRKFLKSNQFKNGNEFYKI